MACCVQRHRPGQRRSSRPDKAAAPAHQPGPRLQLRPDGQARRRDRQRDRGRHRRRPPPPTAPGDEDRPDRRGAAPPLQPHGHQPARLRPLGHAGPLPQPGRLVRRARDHDLAEHARAVDRPRQPRGRARHRREARRTTASSSPPARAASSRTIEGFGAPGTGVLRTAADAMALRAYAQRVGSRRGVVAGGGLLGLEAAYALHKLGLKNDRPGALRPPAPPPARPARRRAAEVLPRRPRARDRPRGRSRRRRRQRPPARPRPHGRTPPAGADPARRRRHRAQRRDRPRRASSRINRGVLVDDRMRTGDPAHPRGGRHRRVRRPDPGPVADRGRPGRGRGRERRRRRPAVRRRRRR